MKEAELKPTIAAIDQEVTALSAERDAITEKIRALTAKRADLEALVKVIEMPPSKIRAHMIKAAGIESAEKFGNG